MIDRKKSIKIKVYICSNEFDDMAGIEISYGFAKSPFGHCFIAWIENKICQLSFFDNVEYEMDLFAKKFSGNKFIQNDRKAVDFAQQIFEKNERPHLQLEGTDFQKKVWKALLEIPANTTTTYADIAEKIGKPKAVRAVASAVGANPIAYLIPCHRIIRSDGTLGGYRWGLEVKKKMLAYESLNSLNSLKSLRSFVFIFSYFLFSNF